MNESAPKVFRSEKVVPRTRLIGRKIPLRLSSSTLVKQHAKSEEHLFISGEEYTAIAAVEFKSLREETRSTITNSTDGIYLSEVNNKKKMEKISGITYKTRMVGMTSWPSIYSILDPMSPHTILHSKFQDSSVTYVSRTSEDFLIHLYK
ncbi:hypothetical protein JCM33374_g4205 [Metschnikowia sp. JCM 33374]|nr:hypothetical protein JCM33374_g4205 [Metschnikowia sp. JCM 33374]